MELSSSVLKSIKSIGAKLNTDIYTALLNHIFNSFEIKQRLDISNLILENLSINTDRSEAELKEAAAALLTIILEFARYDFDANYVSTFLEDNGFPNDKITIFVEQFTNKIHYIRLYLLSSSNSFPHIVDFKWKLDYSIKESNLERVNEPIYTIELLVEKPSHRDLVPIQFKCTIEQLQDLVHKLREATKSVEKLSQAAS